MTSHRFVRDLVVAVFLVAVCAVGPAFSQEPVVIGVHTASRHLPKYEWQNNSNPGVYARWSNGLTAGTFKNTIDRNTIYVGRTFYDVVGPVDVLLAGATGYRIAPVVPLAMASIELAPRTWKVAPRISAGRGADSWVLHLSVEGRF